MTQFLHEGRALRRLPVWAVAGALVAALAGCAALGDAPPQAVLRDAASVGLPADAPAGLSPRVDSRWWMGFGDAQIDTLVESALQGNPNLQAAAARVAKAQAAVGGVRAVEWPQVKGELDLSRQKFAENFIYPAPLGGSIQDIGLLQFSAGWELDFFGKNRAAIEAAVGNAQAAVADAQAARVLLASNVVRGYLQWARLEAQSALARRTLAQREETLRLVRERVSAGLDTRLELRQSEGGLPEARQQVEALAEQIEIARHALAALVARPGVVEGLRPPMLAAIRPIAIEPALNAELLGRRADIAAARWRAEAATRDVDYARRQFYPNVDLTAFVGMQALGFGKLLKAGSEQWGVGPAISLPVFDGGRLRANLRGKAADRDAAIESYNATIVDAVRDVADQISSVQSIGRQQVQQRQAQSAAEAAYQIAVQRYGVGLGNYLNVLAAETAVLAQRRQAADLAARELEAQVALARALGGGWQPDDAQAAAWAASHGASAGVH